MTVAEQIAGRLGGPLAGRSWPSYHGAEHGLGIECGLWASPAYPGMLRKVGQAFMARRRSGHNGDVREPARPGPGRPGIELPAAAHANGELAQGHLGLRIRAARKQQGRLLREVAQASGLSVSYLSDVERGATVPSIGALKRIADALGVSMGSFFEEQQQTTEGVLRKHERRRLVISMGGGEVRYELLAPDVPRRMEPILATLGPGATTSKTPYSHAGEEWGLVVQGQLHLVLGDREVVLEEGDSVYFSSSQPHRLVNKGKTPCVYIWVSMPAAHWFAAR